MGLLFDGIQIEERRPRSWNEPRRKRLSFVREHKKKSSDEWAVVPRNREHGRYYRNDAETWDLRQWDAQRRFLEREQDRQRMIEYHHHQMQPLPPPHMMHGHPGHHEENHHLRPLIEEIHPHHRGGGGDPDDIIAIEDGSDSDSSCGHRGRSGHRIPLSIEKGRDHSPFASIIHLNPKKHKKGKKKYDDSSSSSPSSSSSSSDGDGSFLDGYRAGRLATKKKGSLSPVPARRRFQKIFDDFSDDSMDMSRRRRSRSRGRRH